MSELFGQMSETNPYETNLHLLEMAHLYSQPFAYLHFIVHWKMFKLAFGNNVWKEVIGQIPRLILAMPGPWLGKAPKGNIGTTKMGIFEIKED
jgi:hypothetical protein